MRLSRIFISAYVNSKYDKVQLGDTIIIQDTHASDPIYLKSKVISKTVSLADPVNNSFVVGEFSPIVIGADNGLEDTNQIMQLVNQANQTAVNAQNKANENAQKIADTRTDLEKTISPNQVSILSNCHKIFLKSIATKGFGI